jgi:hypothetical protein
MLDRSFSSHHALLTRRILEAMGLGSAAVLALAAPACGGRVVLDGAATSTGGSGGAGATVGSVASVASTGTGNFICDAIPPPGHTLVYGCIITQGGCPPALSGDTAEMLGQALNTYGPCPTDPDFCSCSNTVVAVACGPDPTVPGCCYMAEMTASEVCEGRPFVVGGAARTADVVARGDFCAAVHPVVAALEPPTRRALAEAWAADARHEHASVASFARFVLELLSLGAPAELVRAAQQAIGEEIRHAELCFGIASALSGETIGRGPLDMRGALAGRGDAAAMAAAVVREGCVGETLAALAALAARDAASDPAVRAALGEIAADETSHAALAWRAAAWMWEHGDAATRAAIERAFAEAAPTSGVSPAGAIDPGIARAFGRLPDEERAQVVARGLAEVVRPCARALTSARPTDAQRASAT